METKTIVTYIIVSLILGVLIGLTSIPLSKKLTLSRTEDPADAAPLNKPVYTVLTAIVSVAAVLAIMFTAKDYGLMVRNILFVLPLLSLSIVDILVRKIPNPLLLSMLIVELGYIIYYCISEKSIDILMKVFIGFMLGMFVTLIPGFLKIPMGAGDKKLSAVIGICLYAAGYFQAMILMALFVALFYVYLKIRKKGDMKTLMPMGPFLSLGAVITMCFSIFDVVDVAFNI